MTLINMILIKELFLPNSGFSVFNPTLYSAFKFKFHRFISFKLPILPSHLLSREFLTLMFSEFVPLALFHDARNITLKENSYKKDILCQA